jgi:hypothetical protein
VTPIYSARIDHLMAWRGGDFSKDDVAFDLSPKQVAALEDVLLKVRGSGLALGQIRAEDCGHPALDRGLERVFDEIQEGRGIVIVRGMPVDAHSVEDVATMFWAIGTHFGQGVSQVRLATCSAWSGMRRHQASLRAREGI